jgi:hypothetical protein
MLPERETCCAKWGNPTRAISNGSFYFATFKRGAEVLDDMLKRGLLLFSMLDY